MEENTAVLETPEVIKHTGTEWYQKISLKESDIFIRSNMQSTVRNVIATGYFLKHIRDNQLYLEDGYQNVNEFAMDRYGFSASTVSRYIARNTKFSKGGNSPYIDEKFKEFNKSQLQEMLGISDEQLEQVTPDMTVREIRSMARPKEIPYIEIPGQTELKDIPGVMPEERTESFEASTAELFGVEADETAEDESVVQPAAGKTISQEIPVAELMEEEDAEIATSQMIPESSTASEQRNLENVLTDVEVLKFALQEAEDLLDNIFEVQGTAPSEIDIRKHKLIIAALKAMLRSLDEKANFGHIKST